MRFTAYERLFISKFRSRATQNPIKFRLYEVSYHKVLNKVQRMLRFLYIKKSTLNILNWKT